MNISATFKEMFELDEFPLDYQALNIWLISEWSYSELDLVKDDEYMDRLAVNTFTGELQKRHYAADCRILSAPIWWCSTFYSNSN